MKTFISLFIGAIFGLLIFFGYKIMSISSEISKTAENQVPHLKILSPDPIIAESIFYISAFSPADEDRASVLMIKIIRVSDKSSHGGKALKLTFQPKTSLTAPSQSGDYSLSLEGMEQPFRVFPIIAQFRLANTRIKTGDTIPVKLETNTNGSQKVTLESMSGEILKQVRNGFDQDITGGELNILAPMEPGPYKLVYRASLGGEITSVSFQVEPL